MDRITPMFQQYLEIKQRHRDSILFFRMGDFYEMFFEDAEVASKLLDIALTTRDRDKESGVPMCGVPVHSASSYVAKLVQQGYKVAICEQVEDPRSSKGLVRRDVVRVVTPGLVLDPDGLISEENNFLMAIYPQRERYGIAALDLSTGEFSFTEVSGERLLASELERLKPREVLLPEGMQDAGEIRGCLAQWKPALVNYRPARDFSSDEALRALCDHFQVVSIEALGVSGMNLGLGAAAAAFAYAQETQGQRLSHIRDLKPYSLLEYMVLDDWTRRNLELFENLQDRSKRDSLLWVMDQTVTPMGARTMRRWLGHPLLDRELIERRLDAVEELTRDQGLMDDLRAIMGRIQDLERLTARVSSGLANARDLVGLRRSLEELPILKERISTCTSRAIKDIHDSLDPLVDVASHIASVLVDDPPVGLKEGGLIRQGVSEELDRWVRISRDTKAYIAEMEAKERTRTGIPNLKIGYNRVFGFYIEVTKSYSKLVPKDYIRKQTLVNAERYVNEELKGYELQVLEAEERRTALEYQIFEELRESVAREAARVQQTARLVAELDCLASFARVAVQNHYCRPKIAEGKVLRIKDGRHPVVERMPLSERFVPNDLELDGESKRMVILTGPNMAGKSTYLRQVALIVLMAQAGSFVPAREAEIGIVDRIFTRVGAMDNLARGQSTFMVEMMETAQILKGATPKSLIILDEVGRGTGTIDGLSIAWAVAEHILDCPALRSRTLFATHYHELTELALIKEGVRNFHMAVKEWNDKVIFLRRVVEGGTNRSYGIQVARLAGLPMDVIRRAMEIMANLENGELDEVGQPRMARSKKGQRAARIAPRQLSLFGGRTQESWLEKEIRGVDVEVLTPIEALNLIHRWKQLLSQ